MNPIKARRFGRGGITIFAFIDTVVTDRYGDNPRHEIVAVVGDDDGGPLYTLPVSDVYVPQDDNDGV